VDAAGRARHRDQHGRRRGDGHTGELFSIVETGGYALELQAMYLLSAIAIALLGAGRYSLAGARGRWN
jgi:putative oxidoreductase